VRRGCTGYAGCKVAQVKGEGQRREQPGDDDVPLLNDVSASMMCLFPGGSSCGVAEGLPAQQTNTRIAPNFSASEIVSYLALMAQGFIESGRLLLVAVPHSH